MHAQVDAEHGGPQARAARTATWVPSWRPAMVMRAMARRWRSPACSSPPSAATATATAAARCAQPDTLADCLPPLYWALQQIPSCTRDWCRPLMCSAEVGGLQQAGDALCACHWDAARYLSGARECGQVKCVCSRESGRAIPFAQCRIAGESVIRVNHTCRWGKAGRADGIGTSLLIAFTLSRLSFFIVIIYIFMVQGSW